MRTARRVTDRGQPREAGAQRDASGGDWRVSPGVVGSGGTRQSGETRGSSPYRSWSRCQSCAGASTRASAGCRSCTARLLRNRESSRARRRTSLFTVAEGTAGITAKSSPAIAHARSISPEAAWAKDLRKPYRARVRSACGGRRRHSRSRTSAAALGRPRSYRHQPVVIAAGSLTLVVPITGLAAAAGVVTVEQLPCPVEAAEAVEFVAD